MKIVSGSEALIAIGLPVYIRNKSRISSEWKQVTIDASLSLFLRDSNIFEYGIPIQDK